MAEKISLDIVICTYNNAPLLKRALEAISKQKNTEGIEWQVTVVNNNCTDETPEVVEKHAANFLVPLRMIFETTQGLVAARLCGARNTSGKWIAYIDDDCLLAEDWVEKAESFISEHPEIGAFGAKIILDWEIEPPLYASRRRWAFAGKNHGDEPKKRDWLAGTGMTVRRQALIDSGWMEKQFLQDRTGASLVSGGDMEMGRRIARLYEMWYNPACKLRHIIPARRLTREYMRRITFGLGGSRHNEAALMWKGGYPGWLLYSAVYSVGLLVFSGFDAIREFVSSTKEADIPTAFAPVFGWWSAMRGMFGMDKTERNQLLGCAKRK